MSKKSKLLYDHAFGFCCMHSNPETRIGNEKKKAFPFPETEKASLNKGIKV